MPVIQDEAVAAYTGIGKKQVIETTTWQNPWRYLIDPLAQSFTLAENRFITAVGLYFHTKDPSIPVTVQIRNVVNGYPGSTVLVSKTLRPTDVSVSTNGSVEIKATFDEPVLLYADTEYCIVIITTADQYRLFVARLAENDLISGVKVTRQPYTVGVLFSSSNASTWTAHQEMDLKFKLYGAVFSDEAILRFNSVPVDNVGMLLLAVGELIPQGCSILWQWSPDSSQWYPLNDSNVTALSAIRTTVYVKAILMRGGKTSPVIHVKSATLVGLSYKAAGVYVTKQVSADNFSDILVYVDLNTPSGTTQTLQYSIDDGANWLNFESPTAKQVSAEYFQYRYTKHLASPATHVRIRLNATSNSRLVTPRARRLMLILS